jgi:hypothetical protein
MFYHFLFRFFLLTSSFAAAQSPHVTATLSLEGPPGPTTDRDGDDVRRGRKDMTTLTCPASPCPCTRMCHVAVPLAAARRRWCCGTQHVAVPLMAARTTCTFPFVRFLFSFFLLPLLRPSRCALTTILADGRVAVLPSGAPRGCMQHVTVSLTAARTVSPCPSWLHAPCSFRWLTPCSFPFFFFLLTSPFAVQSLCSHHHPCRRTSGCPPPQEPTTAQPPTVTTMARWR